MSAATRISIVIATHNRPHFLLEALDCIAAQHCPPLEVIIVDDGSGPKTRRAVACWRAREGGPPFALRYVRQDNAGPAVARNRGAALARGDYLQFMDDDDLMEPDTLLRLAAALRGRGGAVASMASYVSLQQRGGVVVAGTPAVAPSPYAATQRLAAMIAGHWFVPIHGYLFTREAVACMGPWDASLSSQEDDEWLLRAVLQGVDFVPAPAAMVYYRQHDGLRRATPGRPGESVLQGLRKRLLDDLAIRERVSRELRARRALEPYRAAFQEWQRRLRERYGAQLEELEEGAWTLLTWLAQGRRQAVYRSPPLPHASAAGARRVNGSGDSRRGS